MNKRSTIKMPSPKIIIILTLITTIIVACFSLSKYESTLAGRSKTTVALMANSIKVNLTNIAGKPRGYFYT